MNRIPVKLLLVAIGVGMLFLCIAFFMYFTRVVQSVEKQFGLTPVSLYQLATDGESMIKSTNGRVNILLLGVGGGEHEGPDLTDTIIVASFYLSQKTLSLISIPRDIWSDTLKDKVNSAYHYGEEKNSGEGLTLASTATEEIIGIPIHYAMVIDFSQFEDLIDYIGGVDITVPVAFVDSSYPIAGRENDECQGDQTYVCRYQTVEFSEGLQHMDGKRALMYVRSRHAEGNEGNDFSRGRRQQDVIIAIKAKILALEPWYHPDMSMRLFQSFDNATKTNLTIGQLLALGKLSIGIQSDQINKISIESLLTEAPFEKYERYALEPKEDALSIKEFIRTSLGNN